MAGVAGPAAVVALVVVARTVDPGAAAAGIRAGLDDPVGLVVIAGALLAAFGLRAVAWALVLPGLGRAQALAGIHLALGANHILPLRLGEPLRVVSVVRRARIPAGPATASTVTLRSADLVALAGLGLVAAPGVMWSLAGAWGAAGLVAVAVGGAVGLVGLVRMSRAGHGVRPPGPALVALVVAAWLAEAVVVWRVIGWFGVELEPATAVVILAAAVSVQVVAVTPGGIGTYEAAAAAALVTTTGMRLGEALAAALVLHGVKTAYSLVAGASALFLPAPGLVGRWRMPRRLPAAPPPRPGPGPVVLFLPARNEGPRIGPVVAAAPTTVAGRPVEVIVVDDGSRDDTAEVARNAGATVVTNRGPHGLGAAVRCGLAAATGRGAAAVAFCDADGEYDAAQLADLVAPILAGDAHYVVGSRFGGEIGRMLPHRRFGNRTLTLVVRWLTRRPITDGQSGYRAFSAEAAAAAVVAHDYNYAQVLTVDLLARGFGYHEVPIRYTFRESGRSFVRLGPYLRRVVPTVWAQLQNLPVTAELVHGDLVEGAAGRNRTRQAR
ncbi:MAG: lysylphosphatidylglycerol synthase domain-containing protein [Acidimicrobiales bacterium]